MVSVGRLAISALCVASSVALGLACSNDTHSTGGDVPSAGGSSPTSDAGMDAADGAAAPESIVFDPADTLTLDPKEMRELVVRTTPPGSFHVSFALLGPGVEDAALDANAVDTDETGVGRVTLTAPSTPTTFNVRASVTETAQRRLAVSVSARNYTTLDVLPSYSGKRPITTWTATAAAGVTCSALSGNPPPDGDLSASASPGKPLAIQKVPVGVPLAVTLRAGHYVGGCVDQPPLSEGDGNQVLVYASDRPLNLAQTKLDVSFGPTNPSAALGQLMSAANADIANALDTNATSDVTALLDAMQAATVAASRDSYWTARQTYNWDAALTAAFGSGATTRLRTPVMRWINAGLTNFYVANAFQGTLAPHGTAVTFTPRQAAGISAADAGLPSSISGTWSADSSDTLLVGLELSWQPSHLLAALALPAATAEFPSATTVDAALATSVSCGLVGQTLAAHGPTPNTAYEACDAACISTACAQAITALWKNAANASGTTSASLSVTATGAADVADDASINRLAGSWIGTLDIGDQNAPASGPIAGTAAGN